MEFRLLKKDEIIAEKAQVNKGGVKVLLWKNRFATADILNETVGDSNWYMEYRNGNKNCVLHVRQESGWITREGVGDKPTPKALASDALSNAGTVLGIGRELYTAPEIFIFKSDLAQYMVDEETGEPKCYNHFTVEDIAYEGRKISSVTIGVWDGEKLTRKKTFGKTATTQKPEQAEAKASSDKAAVKTEAPATTAPAKAETVAKAEEKKVEKPAMSDETIILIGNCKGMTYGAAKSTQKFVSFLQWVKNKKPVYENDPAKNAQAQAFLAM